MLRDSEPVHVRAEAIRRIVVKVGTSTLIRGKSEPNYNVIADLVNQIATLKARGIEVILVTSGAIGFGMGRLGLGERPEAISDRQALAAVGQGRMMQLYEDLFWIRELSVAQVLLTREDLEDPVRSENAAATLTKLLAWDVLPIINENDTVAYEQIKVGDNDTLSARVAALVEADCLVLLSDVPGLCREDPRKVPDSPIIRYVPEVSDDVLAMAGGAGTSYGSGGMLTKLEAARIAQAAGIPMALTLGSDPEALAFLWGGELRGTWFGVPERDGQAVTDAT